MNIKKIIAVIMASLLLTCNSVMAAANEDDAAYEAAQRLLVALDVSFFNNPESTVTYNNFNSALAIALDTGNIFSEITALTGISYSTVTGGKPISFDDALRSLINITGYRIEVTSYNGSINGYIPTAVSRNILKNVSVKPGEDLTSRDAAVMIYNALETDVLQCFYTGDGVDYRTVKGETLLYEYRKIRKDSGIAEANEYTAVDGGKCTGAGRVRINDKIYYDKEETVSDLLGYAVEYYYCENSDNEGDIVAAWKDEHENDEIIIADNYLDNEGRKIIYYDNREKYEVIPQDAVVVYNGIAMYEYNNSVFDFSSKDAVLLDNDDDGDIDVVFVNEGTDRYVSKSDTEHGIIYDGLSREEINLDDYERVRIFDSEGKKTNSFALSEADVITVYTSADNELIDIFISKKHVMGIIEARFVRNGKTYFTVAGEDYPLSDAFKKYMNDSAALAMTCDFYLNQVDEIVYAKPVTSTMQYGYVLKCKTDGGLGDDAYVRLLSQDGEIYYYKLSEKARVDGKSYKSAKNYVAVLTPQLIRYEINENNELTAIDTVAQGSGETVDTLSSFGAKTQMAYNSAFVGFDGNIKIETTTPVFFCPSSTDSYEGYGVAYSDYLKSAEKYQVQAFASDSKSCVAEAVVIDCDINKYKKVDKFSKSYVVADIVRVAHDDGGDVYKLTVFNRINRYEIICADTEVGVNEDINTGDIINGALDGQGRFCDIVKVYDAKTHTSVESDVIKAFEGTDFSSRCRMADGYVYFNNGTTIGLSQSEPSGDFIKNELDYFKVNDSLGVIVDSNYDTDDDRHIRRASMAEVKDYLHFQNCARAFVRTDQGNSTFIVIYQ